MFTPKVGDQFDVEIQDLAFRGPGVARVQQFVVFVPFAAPGDLVRIEILKTKKNYSFARLVNVIRPSLQRREPPCSYFFRCGGCNWQHLEYNAQLEQKNKVVKKFFSDFTKNISPIIKSPKEFFYRSRIQLHQKGQQIGYYEKNSHQLIDIETCWLADQKINDLLRKKKHEISSETEDINFFINDLGEANNSNSELFFTQINQDQIVNIKNFLIQKIKEISFKKFYDLYSGAGHFSLGLFSQFPKAQYVAVESNSLAVRHAQGKAQSLSIGPKKFEIYCSPVDLFLKRTAISEDSIVLLNPPRAGTNLKVLKSLSASPAKYLFYLSCNPSTLRRDLMTLKKLTSGHLKIDFIQPFDMFPQTDHIEVLAGIILN